MEYKCEFCEEMFDDEDCVGVQDVILCHSCLEELEKVEKPTHYCDCCDNYFKLDIVTEKCPNCGESDEGVFYDLNGQTIDFAIRYNVEDKKIWSKK